MNEQMGVCFSISKDMRSVVASLIENITFSLFTGKDGRCLSKETQTQMLKGETLIESYEDKEAIKGFDNAR